jgi:hypothetical protein
MHAAALACTGLLLAAAPARAAEQARPVAPARAAEQSMVLIVSADSPVQHLDVIDVRKLFLGLTVINNAHRLRALDNRSDDRLRQAFLQNVIAMPERAYEKRLLSITLQQGARRPEPFAAAQDLLDALAADPTAVAVAWAAEVAKDHRIRVLRVLWRD